MRGTEKAQGNTPSVAAFTINQPVRSRWTVNLRALKFEIETKLVPFRRMDRHVLPQIALALERFLTFRIRAWQGLNGEELVRQTDVRLQIGALRKGSLALRTLVVLALVMHRRSVGLEVETLNKRRLTPLLVALEGSPALVNRPLHIEKNEIRKR